MTCTHSLSMWIQVWLQIWTWVIWSGSQVCYPLHHPTFTIGIVTNNNKLQEWVTFWMGFLWLCKNVLLKAICWNHKAIINDAFMMRHEPKNLLPSLPPSFSLAKQSRKTRFTPSHPSIHPSIHPMWSSYISQTQLLDPSSKPFFYVMASGGLYSLIYINNSQS